MTLTSIRTLTKESFYAYKSLLWRMIQIELVPLIIMVVTAVLAAVSLTLVGPIAGVSIFILGIIVSIVFGIASGIAMIQTVHNSQEPFRLKRAYEATRPYFIAYFFTSLLSAIFIVLGFLLFIIPGIIALVWLSFTYFIVVIEGKRGMSALRGSKELVRGLWFPVFFRIVALILMLIVVTVVSNLLFVFIQSETAQGILSNIFSLIISPYAVVYMYRLYRDLKTVHEHKTQEPAVVLA